MIAGPESWKDVVVEEKFQRLSHVRAGTSRYPRFRGDSAMVNDGVEPTHAVSDTNA